MITNKTTQASAMVEDIRDIKPPLEISDGLAWLWWTLASLTLVGVVGYVIYSRK